MSVILLVLVLVIGPFVLGLCFLTKQDLGVHAVVKSWVCGTAFSFALFELVYIPSYFANLSYRRFLFLFLGIAGVLFLLEAIVYRRRFGKFVKEIAKNQVSFFLVAAFLVSAMLTAAPAVLTNGDDDDAFYVATATTAQETNSIFRYNAYTGRKIHQVQSRYVLSPFPFYLAGLSSVSRMHVAALAHRWIPVFFIPLSLSVLYLFGAFLYPKENGRRHLFFLLTVLLTLFSGYSVKNASVFLLYRIWQGKAILASILLPLIWLCFLWRVQIESEEEVTFLGKMRFYVLLTMLSIACGMVSSMGIFLAPMLIGLLALLLGYQKRSFKLVVQTILCAWPSVCLGILYLTVFS